MLQCTLTILLNYYPCSYRRHIFDIDREEECFDCNGVKQWVVGAVGLHETVMMNLLTCNLYVVFCSCADGHLVCSEQRPEPWHQENIYYTVRSHRNLNFGYWSQCGRSSFQGKVNNLALLLILTRFKLVMLKIYQPRILLLGHRLRL